MKICLIQPLNPELEGLNVTQDNVDYIKGGRTPLGILYLASTVMEDGHNVKIIDRGALHFKHDFKRDEVDRETQKTLLSYQPDLIGISVVTGVLSDALHIARMIRSLKEFRETILVMGGYHCTVESESLFDECSEVDAIFRGYAELAFLDFVNGKTPEEIDGITLRKPGINSKYYSKSIAKLPRNLDDLPFPARHLLDMDYYTHPNSAAVPGLHVEPVTFISSRGCPSRCRFCGADRVTKTVRAHSPEYVIREIEHNLANYRISCVVFADHIFLAKRSRVMAFCDLMIQKGLHKIVSWTANSRVDTISRDVLDYMKEAGCVWVCYGFESGSQRMLELMNKKTAVEDNLNAARVTREAGILFNASMIAGLPGETEDDFLQSIKFIEETKPCTSGFNLFTPLPGSDYYYRFLDQGILDRNHLDWREVGQLNVKKSQSFCEISPDRLEELLHQANTICSREGNLNYYKYNYLKNPREALHRLEFNGVKGDIESEPCYVLLRDIFKTPPNDSRKVLNPVLV